MDLCVHFGKPAFIVFISLYLYFGFSNKHFSIQFNSTRQSVFKDKDNGSKKQKGSRIYEDEGDETQIPWFC